MSKKVVILFSPGLDSFLGDWISKKTFNNGEEIEKVYVDINSRYSQFEIDFLTKWYDNQIKILPGPDMSKLETESAFVPNRNAILACVAQAYTSADIIIFNATFDDRVSDGSVEFRGSLSEVLTITNKRYISVKSLLKDKEKSKHVEEFIQENPEKRLDLLNKTYSCYNSDLFEFCDVPYFKRNSNENSYIEEGKTIMYGCMSCVACYRRLCALTAANIYVPFYDQKIIDEYMKKDIDKKIYPNRYKTMLNYYNFVKSM